MGGVFSTDEFVRDDKVVGRGKEVLQFCKDMHITKSELNRLFHAFEIHADKNSHVITLSSFFKKLKTPYTLIASVLFQFYDIHKTGELSFYEFLVITWAFLSADEDSLAVLCFSLFDTSAISILDIDEITYLIQVVWEFNPSKSALKALKKLGQNKDGTVTVAEFVLLSKHHPALLLPVRQMKLHFRKNIIFSRFWRQLMRRRNNFFPSPSHSIQIISRTKENYLTYSMDYLNLRSDIVPRQYVEQYKLLQRKKQLSRKGEVEWPYEVQEHYKPPSKLPEHSDPAQEEGYETKSTSAQAYTVHNSVSVPSVLRDAYQQGSGKTSAATTIYSPSQQQIADMHYII